MSGGVGDTTTKAMRHGWGSQAVTAERVQTETMCPQPQPRHLKHSSVKLLQEGCPGKAGPRAGAPVEKSCRLPYY